MFKVNIIDETFLLVCFWLSFSDGPVLVKVGFWILSIEKIDVANMVCCRLADDLIVYFRAASKVFYQNLKFQKKNPLIIQFNRSSRVWKVDVLNVGPSSDFTRRNWGLEMSIPRFIILPMFYQGLSLWLFKLIIKSALLL